MQKEAIPEIQALRGISVLLVVIFHIWPTFLPGGFVGVDVFFVISGYIISLRLFAEVRAKDSISLREFWSKRINRLFPAAYTVLIAVLVGTVLSAPITAWYRTAQELVASALYYQNWLLVLRATDYFAVGESATPLQHYWSLSIEEQFYIVWPVFLAVTAWLSKMCGVRFMRASLVLVLLMWLFSFAYSVLYSRISPDSAYFSSFTHVWELASGILIAGFGIELAGRFSQLAISWLGVLFIVGSAFLLSGDSAFPGWIAIFPVLGAAAILVSATGRGKIESNYLLGFKPLQFVGDISYSLYLWHWPVIMFFGYRLHGADFAYSGWVILAISFVLAYLTKIHIEDRFRYPRCQRISSKHSLFMALSGAVLITLAGGSMLIFYKKQVNDAAGKVFPAIHDQEHSCYGALAGLNPIDCIDSGRLRDQNLLLETYSFTQEPDNEKNIGALHVKEYSASSGEHTVALIGDSHAEHYLPALREIASKHNWRLWLIIHHDCSPSTPTWASHWPGDMAPGCQAWREDLLRLLPKEESIDVIVTSSVAPRIAFADSIKVQSQALRAFTNMWSSWSSTGKKVLVIADVPGPHIIGQSGNVGECIATRISELSPCKALRNIVVERDVMAEAARQDGRVSLLDLTEIYCDEEYCHAVIGGLMVYGDGHHLTPTFSKSLTPLLEPTILELFK